jgi:hypothetical protein
MRDILTHASLFSGIGGPEVAAAMLGFRNAFHCEINPFGRAVLDYWFPESKSYEDITKTDFRPWRGQIDILTAGFPCQPFSYAGKRGGQPTSVTSGRRLLGLLTKSGPLGSLVRTLLESPLWSKEGYSLTWVGRGLFSERWREFTDTDCDNPLPSNASAVISRTSDIPSSRCLFQLRLSELPIDETESSSLPILMTPTTIELCESPERMRERARRKGYRNGTKYNSLSSQLMHDPRCKELLPTPTAIEGEKYTNTFNPDSQMGQSLSAMAGSGLLPTPTARDEKNPSSPDGERIARKKKQGWTIELSDLAAMKVLPTPTHRDYQPPVNPEFMTRKNGMTRDDQLACLPMMLGLKDRGGITFRLSPLFTQEMMGFPLGWTELPFLLGNGEQKHSKPTETR